MSSTTFTLVTSAAPPMQQLSQPSVAVIVASAVLPPPSSSSSTLQSCGSSPTILSTSATTSSITTPNQHLNNQSTESTENDQFFSANPAGNISNGGGNSSSILSSSFSAVVTGEDNSNNNNNGMIQSGLTNSGSLTSSLTSSDEFVRTLIDAVRKQPCLYNSNHEHYGNKHSSAQYRATVWLNMCKELNYPVDPHSLQTQWKRIRDRYVRERRKRKAAGIIDNNLDSNLPNLNAAARHYDSMRWIDEFLSESNSNTSNYSIGPPTSSNNSNSPTTPNNSGGVSVGNLSTSGEIYYSQHPNRRRNTKAHEDSLILNHSYRYEQTPPNSLNRSVGSSLRAPKNESANGSPSSTSSEISVGSAAFGAVQPAQSGGQTHLMYRNKTSCTLVAGPPPPQDQQHLVHHAVPSSSSGTVATAVAMSTSDVPYQLLSVPAAGLGGGIVGLPSAAHNGQVKEQVMTMVIDPSTGQFYHQHNPATSSSSGGLISGSIIGGGGGVEIQQQHLISPHHVQQQLIATTSTTTDIQQQQMLHPPRRKRLAMAQVTASRQQQHMQSQSHEMIIEPIHVQQQPQTIVIEQGQDRILINHQQQLQQQQQLGHLAANNSGGSVDGMIVQHHPLHAQQQNSLQIHGNSTHLQHAGITHSGGRLITGRGGRGSGGTILAEHLSPCQQIVSQGGGVGQQHYILSAPAATQHHYDPDSALVETIVSHLANLNDDEKVVTKMNIQRILMDARFGRGACVRMFREEEQSENMAVAAAAAALEVSQQQQNRHLHAQQQSSRR